MNLILKSLLCCSFIALAPITAKAQGCIRLGGAGAYGPFATDSAAPALGGAPGCYARFPYKAIYWQYFYSPSGGDYEQAYIPTDPGSLLELDYLVFDMGTTGSYIPCPVSTSGWTELICNTTTSTGVPTGPGIDDVLTTDSGHYYAIAVIHYPDAPFEPSYNFTIGTPTLGGLPLTAASLPTVLPLQLVSFEGNKAGNTQNLKWLTANEKNIRHFSIERSRDGIKWEEIGRIASNGTADFGRSYSYADQQPYPGSNFYRLHIQELSGRSEYSNILKASFDKDAGAVTVYPNPAKTELSLDATREGCYIVTDALGRILLQGQLSTGKNSINVSGINNGLYLLTTEQAGRKEVQRVQVSN